MNTVGLDEELVRRYVKYQEKQEKKREREPRNYDLFSWVQDPFRSCCQRIHGLWRWYFNSATGQTRLGESPVACSHLRCF